MSYDRSEKVEVKPGVFRNVRVDVSGKAVWNMPNPHGGTTYTAGDVVNGKYKPLNKYRAVIENYVPTQDTSGRSIKLTYGKSRSYHDRIHDNVLERRHRNQTERVLVFFDNGIRSFSWKGKIHGDLSYEGVWYYGVFVDDEFVIRSSTKHYENDTVPLPVGTRIPARKINNKIDNTTE